MNRKVLCVDDDPRVLTAYQRNLADQFSLETALNGEEALRSLTANGPFAVVVADMRMPKMDGIELLTRVQQSAPDTIRIMLTGNADQQTAVDAVNKGHVYRFLNKPCPPDVLGLAIEAGVEQFKAAAAERELLERTFNGAIQMLTEVLGNIYPEAFGLSQKVRDYVREYARFFNMKDTWALEAAALLAPVGYLTLPGSLVAKAINGQELTEPERKLFQRLPEIGANLLSQIPRLEAVAAIVRYQHRNYDGSGEHQDPLAGEDIPIGARILHVLQDLAQLESPMLERAQVLAGLHQRPGVYDPRVLDSACACFDVELQKPDFQQPVVQACKLEELSVRQRLVGNVETADGVLVVAAGTELTPLILHRLRNFATLNRIKEPIIVQVPGSHESGVKADAT